MASYAPPKFKAFTKTKVVLSLESTPLPVEQNTDLTAHVKTPFRAATGSEADFTEGASGPEGPEMFKRKLDKKPKAARGTVTQAGPGTSEFIGMATKAKKTAAPAQRKPYSRLDVMSRDVQDAQVQKLPQDLQEEAKVLLDIETANPYSIEPVDTFVPMSRYGFGSFLVNKYGPIFPKGTQKALDVATCAAKGDEGVKEVKIYHYQAFIREYLRFESPYRGLLVYHGLGSGKTCSAIAAAEALFGTRGLKIVVMTPFSLRDNFISEINFCGFRHFRLQNHWTSLSLKSGSNPDPAMVRMFAQNIYGIPDSFFAKRAKGRAQLERIWIPDFEQAPNFDSLSPVEKDEIKTQLKTTIEHRIHFINYNGISAQDLKTMVCSTPDIFDNAVIVVDEIHNLIRLIQGSLEPYFSNPPGRRRTLPLEVLTPDRKKLPLCGMTKNYMRGYLFYRLFMDAKNCKIVGLSGTPLINFPEELGILANILHGAIHKIDFIVKVEAGREIIPLIEKIVNRHEDLDTVHSTVSEGSVSFTVTRLPEQFIKIFSEEGEVLGIQRRDPGKPIPTLESLWLGLMVLLKADGIQVLGKGNLAAQELLPSWDTPFRGAFLEEDGVTLKRKVVLQKRLRGLVSYYRGIQGDVMPKVIKDEIVGVPLTGYSLKIYNKLRNQEIQIEMKKPKATGTASDAIWAEINEIATMKSASNYRMSSRQACNFAFPEGLARPRPHNLEEDDVETGKDRDVIIDADVEGGVAGKDEDDAKSVRDEEGVKQEALEEIGKKATPVAVGTKEAKAAYQAALRSAKDKLRSMGKTHLQLDGPPESNLAKYSPKFSAMLKNINKLNGSSLVYSNFLEMEGIGIFGICMEANGYEPIQVVSSVDGLKFSERTIASLAKGPKIPEKRYIEFTGAGSKEQRGAAVDVFNARLDKLPPALQKVLSDAGWTNNYDGGLCRAFCITSAGAEGLSLKCVRGVHIMEPYWNTVRTQQVKGRAVRICSHMDLPKEEQNVEIYTYCTIIPEQAILAQAIDKTLENNDAYPAKDAIALGVPVPAQATAGEEIPGDMFFKVAVGQEEVVEETPMGSQVTSDGPIRFSSKLDNEYHGFSTFAKSLVTINGKRYPTVEHYYQAMRFPTDLEWQEAIRVSPTPAKARQLGSQKDHPIDPNWDNRRMEVMMTGMRAKFQQNSGVLQQLKDTGVRPLIEASPDAFWGEGRTGNGKNQLGKLLEQVREELREYVIEGSIAAPVVVPATEEFFDDEAEPLAVASPMASPAPMAAPEPAGSVPVAEPVAAPEPVAGPVTDILGPEEAEPTQKGGNVDEDRVVILTSDQKVLLISLRKEKVISSLQTLMKSVAVDCQLNFQDNNDGTYRCMSLGDSIGDFAFHPDLQKDIQETEARFKIAAPIAPVVASVTAPTPSASTEEPVVPKVKPREIIYRKIPYYYKIARDKNNNLLGYIFYRKEDPELTSPIGFVGANPATRMPKGDIGPIPEGVE